MRKLVRAGRVRVDIQREWSKFEIPRAVSGGPVDVAPHVWHMAYVLFDLNDLSILRLYVEDARLP